jgi:hypothetical protein
MTTRPPGAAGKTIEQQGNKAQVTDIPLGTRAIGTKQSASVQAICTQEPG